MSDLLKLSSFKLSKVTQSFLSVPLICIFSISIHLSSIHPSIQPSIFYAHSLLEEQRALVYYFV